MEENINCDTNQEDRTKMKSLLAGVTLCGNRQENGTIISTDGEVVLEDWMEEITICGVTFVLENVIKEESGYENADYA